MNRVPAFALVLVVTTAHVTPIAAQGVPVRGPIPFSSFDRDGSGLIDPQEFDAVRRERLEARAATGMPATGASSPPEFSELDTNGDGRLDQDELTAGQLEIMQDRRAGTANQGVRPGMGRNMPTFTDLDLNADGVVLPAEFDQARAMRIGKLAQQGFQLRNLPQAPTFADIDADGNGQIVPEEFWAHQSKRVEQRMH